MASSYKLGIDSPAEFVSDWFGVRIKNDALRDNFNNFLEYCNQKFSSDHFKINNVNPEVLTEEKFEGEGLVKGLAEKNINYLTSQFKYYSDLGFKTVSINTARSEGLPKVLADLQKEDCKVDFSTMTGSFNLRNLKVENAIQDLKYLHTDQLMHVLESFAVLENNGLTNSLAKYEQLDSIMKVENNQISNFLQQANLGLKGPMIKNDISSLNKEHSHLDAKEHFTPYDEERDLVDIIQNFRSELTSFKENYAKELSVDQVAALARKIQKCNRMENVDDIIIVDVLAVMDYISYRTGVPMIKCDKGSISINEKLYIDLRREEGKEEEEGNLYYGVGFVENRNEVVSSFLDGIVKDLETYGVDIAGDAALDLMVG